MRVVSSRRGDPRWSGGVLKRKIDYFFCEFSKISPSTQNPSALPGCKGALAGRLTPSC